MLDIAFVATEGEPSHTTDEGWEMSRGDVTVRGENDGVTVTDAGASRRLAWGAEAHLRNYTASAFAERIGACPDLAIESWHPESSRETGVSEFALEGRADAPAVGRTMVVLRRK